MNGLRKGGGIARRIELANVGDAARHPANCLAL
jgi:hypothetical protein